MKVIRLQEKRILALYATGGFALLVSGLLLLASFSLEAVPIPAFATVFYAALLVFAKRMLASSAKRRWFALCLVVSLALIVALGGASSSVVYGPSALVLAWLSILG